MPEINRVPFRYEPVDGDLYYDSFRMHFHTERRQDILDTLQYITRVLDTPYTVEGEIRFSDADDEVPEIRDLRYSTPANRRQLGNPFPDDPVRLWPA